MQLPSDRTFADSGGFDVVADQQAAIGAALRPLVPPGSTVALLDFPNHNNVGDNAIWLGERAYLRSAEATVVYCCDRFSYSPAQLRRRLGPDGIILLHGGGNFGTVWPAHQLFRESVVTEFSEHRIVQFPQSVHFQDEKSTIRTQRALRGHPALTVLVRDERSREFVHSTLEVKAQLCPDMAFMIGRMDRPHAPVADVVWISRTDHESSGRLRVPQTYLKVEIVDWFMGEPGRRWSRLAARGSVRLRSLSQAIVSRSALVREHAGTRYADTFDFLAARRLRRGCRMLSRGRVVISDRLHGHILALLLGIPHVILDNNYGKLRAYWECFTRSAPGVLAATTAEEAIVLAEGLVRSA